MALEPLVDYTKPGAGDYYLLSLSSGEETILDPYSYSVAGKNLLMTSLVVPIKFRGKVVGVVGIDMSLDRLQDQVQAVHPYGTGVAALFSNKGLIAALSAKGLASDAHHAAEEGSENMRAMNLAMGDIQSASGNISKIIKTIDEIAFQTNILALNAAVEAARAGDAGAGFAVVAEEVRRLAQRSATAAKETAEKIEDSITKSANGVAISGKVTESLGLIVSKARQVDELVAEIATASREQSQGLDQVNESVTQMDNVTQGNAATAEESASASEMLNSQAATLRSLVAELQELVVGSGAPTVPAGRRAIGRLGAV